jgi:large conductance mechanosensitive channel
MFRNKQVENMLSDAKKKKFHQLIYEFFFLENILGISISLITATLLNTAINWFLDGIVFPALAGFNNGKAIRELFYAMDGKSYNTLQEARTSGVATIAWGAFIEAVLALLLWAIAAFTLVYIYRKKILHPEKSTLVPNPRTETAQAIGGIEMRQINARPWQNPNRAPPAG